MSEGCSPYSAESGPPIVGSQTVSRRPLAGDKCVRRVDLWLTINADIPKYRDERLPEAAEGVFGLPDVDDTKATRALPGDVREQAFDRPVGRRPELASVCQLAHRLLVLLTCDTLEDSHDGHAYLLTPRRKGTRIRRAPSDSITTELTAARAFLSECAYRTGLLSDLQPARRACRRSRAKARS